MLARLPTPPPVVLVFSKATASEHKMYVEVHLKENFIFALLQTNESKKGIRSFFNYNKLVIVWMRLLEIAIIEFESFRAVGEDVVALKLSSTSYPS